MAVPELWRTSRQRYSLRAEICPHCEEAVFPPRAVCPHCHRAVRMVATQPAQTGTATMPVREFIYGMPLSMNTGMVTTVNNAVHAAMQSNGIYLVAAGDD